MKIYVITFIDDESSVDIESLQLGLVLAVVILLNTLIDFIQRQNAIKVSAALGDQVVDLLMNIRMHGVYAVVPVWPQEDPYYCG